MKLHEVTPMPIRGALLVLSLAFGIAPLSAQEARRQLPAHTHGEGKLAVAIDAAKVEIELEAPSSDIVGFEHAAKNAKQRKAIADAKANLAKADSLFVLPADAKCKLASAKVEVIGAQGGKSAGKGGAGHSHSHGHSHGHKGHNHGKDEAHSEFKATYRLDCEAPERLTTLEFPYFKAFERAQKLVVTVVGPKGQTSGEATRVKPLLALAGAV